MSFTTYPFYDTDDVPRDNQPEDSEYMVALIGAAGVGKTSLMRRLGGQPFEPRYFPTDGSFTYVVHFPGVRLIVKEYAGQARYQTTYDTDFDAVLAVTTASVHDTKVAMDLLQHFPNIPYCLVENKNDIKVTNHNMCCSAKTQQNLLEPFRDLVSQLQNNV